MSLLYCTLVPGMMPMGLMFYKISPFVYFMWPWIFTCDLQLLSFVNRCILCCWMFVLKLKFVGSVEFEIWTIVYRENLNDVTMTSFPIWFLWHSHTNLLRVYQSGILNLSFIRLKRAEIYCREVNRELWKKRILSHCDLDLLPKVTNFDRVRASVVSNHLAKTAFKSVHPISWNLFYKQSRTHRHTQRELQWKYKPSNNRGGV